MKRKILILGKNGQLGRAFQKEMGKCEKYNTIFLSRNECDISDTKNVFEVFEKAKPDIIINCAAYNLVDKAEEEQEKTMKVNYVGVYNLATVCDKYHSFLIHYSTDYVFDGTKEGLYTEEDKPNPLNIYAKSKLYGENAVKENLEKYLILRTSWVYGDGTQNFLYKLTQWAQKQEYLKIACDEFSVPTSTKTLVDLTLKAIEKGLYGLFHAVNSGFTSRFEWAREYFKLKGINKFIYPVHQSDFNLLAKRPGFSAMSNRKVKKELGIEIYEWNEELKRFFEQINNV